MEIIPAESLHIDGVVDVFCSAFESSIMFFTPLDEKLKVFFKDAFTLLYNIYEKGFMVAQNNGRVCGYIVMVDDVKKLWAGAVSSGFLVTTATSLIKGDYGIDLSTLCKIVRNKLFYLKFEISTCPSAQLLSIAVHPDHHGKGLGQSLLLKGLEYIDSLGIKTIKLEARPENTAAVKLYKKCGFDVVGEAEDLQGKWFIMLRDTDCL